MKFAKAIAAARETAELSQVQLAKKIGVAPSTVAGWELGTHAPRFDRLKAIAKALGVTTAQLFEAA